MRKKYIFNKNVWKNKQNINPLSVNAEDAKYSSNYQHKCYVDKVWKHMSANFLYLQCAIGNYPMLFILLLHPAVTAKPA